MILTNWILRVRFDSNHQAVAFDTLEPSIRPAKERWMSAGRVQSLVNLRIEPQIGRGNKLVLQLAKENATKCCGSLRQDAGAIHRTEDSLEYKQDLWRHDESAHATNRQTDEQKNGAQHDAADLVAKHQQSLIVQSSTSGTAARRLS
jgi:hypothetical protein